MAIEFLALPSEQVSWLKVVFSREGTWSWLRLRGHGSRILKRADKVDNIDFESNDLMELDLGRSQIQAPVFRMAGQTLDIDFPRSFCVQFDPSLIREGKMLMTGQLAILSRAWYEYYDLNCEPIFTWYRELSRSWKKMFRDEFMVVAVLDDGRKFESRYIHLTSGAIEWWKAGNELKDTTNMTFKYEVVQRTPRKPKVKR